MTADSQSRAVDKLIAALKAEGREDEVAVVQEMRPNKDRELRAAPVTGSPPDQGQQVEPGSSSPVPSVPVARPASLGAHIERWDEPVTPFPKDKDLPAGSTMAAMVLSAERVDGLHPYDIGVTIKRLARDHVAPCDMVILCVAEGRGKTFMQDLMESIGTDLTAVIDPT